MVGFKSFVAFSAAAVLGAAVANAAVTRAGEQSGGASGGGGERCLVEVVSAGANVFNVTRAVRNGRCVCIAAAGSGTQSQVDALRAAQSCTGAPPAVEQGAAGGGNGAVLGVVGAGVVGGAVAAAAGGANSPK